MMDWCRCNTEGSTWFILRSVDTKQRGILQDGPASCLRRRWKSVPNWEHYALHRLENDRRRRIGR